MCGILMSMNEGTTPSEKMEENTMKNIVKSIIETAQECKNGGEYDTAFSLADIAKDFIDEMASTINCPCTWQVIGEELAEEYQGDDWIMENCKLYEYEN